MLPSNAESCWPSSLYANAVLRRASEVAGLKAKTLCGSSTAAHPTSTIVKKDFCRGIFCGEFYDGGMVHTVVNCDTQLVGLSRG
mmetsp:Transcript_9682/g.18516  ORF Transcript_9682/g.18516 Transcript_9682/m.18516 type:complete len:84 (-) Transcript_9682:63-314(-)